ncbi:MAG: hypothetical protein HZB39_18740 [Planctomycetes bacterium]|nr:hypothetical protein [Planctomycetota bacterium]
MFRSALTALLLTAALSAQCQPTIKQTTTFNRGWFCSTMTYCYEICNPAGCVLPIAKFCVDFSCGVGELDADSIQSPAGWTGTVNAATNQVCWSVTQVMNQLQPGQCLAGFCITTECNPRCIEGRQTATFWAGRNVLIQGGVQTQFAFNGEHRNFLAGEAVAAIGTTYQLGVTNAGDIGGQDIVLCSPFALPNGVHVPGFGCLYMNPVLILPLAPAPLGQFGMCQLPLPIPPDTSLSGATLVFQSLALSTQEPRLSNDKVITIR